MTIRFIIKKNFDTLNHFNRLFYLLLNYHSELCCSRPNLSFSSMNHVIYRASQSII